MKKVIFAVMMLAASSAALALPATLIAHNQRSSSGALSTLIWDGSNTGSTGGMTVGAVASTATWDWDGTTLTGMGLYFGTSHISSNVMLAAVIGDRVVDLVINTSANTTSATDYQCREGNFLAGVGAHGCGNLSLGYNGGFDSTLAYNVGGVANCVNRTVGGDDESTGNPRGLFTAAAGGGCDAVDGAFDLWTVVQDPGAGPGTLIISNGVDLTAAGTNYMTFEVVPLPAAAWLLAPAVLAAARFARRRKAA